MKRERERERRNKKPDLSLNRFLTLNWRFAKDVGFFDIVTSL